MRFGLLSEAETHPGKSYYSKYWEMVDEVVFAEKMGWDMYATSEQHFAVGGVSSSAPECIYPYMFAVTEHIKFAHVGPQLSPMMNHPLRVAERIATMDIMSKGRFITATTRGNTTLALRAFQTEAKDTLKHWEEGFRLMRMALEKDVFSFQGDIYQVPPRSLAPKPVTRPYPVIGTTASSEGRHKAAGEMGILCMNGGRFLGWEDLATMNELYKSSWVRDPNGPLVEPEIYSLIYGHVAETDKIARDEGEDAILASLDIGADAFGRLAKMADDYAYFGELREVLETRLKDRDYMRNDSASVIIGGPDTTIKLLEKFEECGTDLVWFRFDSVDHHKTMKAIETVGRHVIPHFKHGGIARSTEDVLTDIRAMRAEVAASPTGYNFGTKS